MSKYVLKFVNRKTSEAKYYRSTEIINKLINGAMCQLREFMLTDDIEKAFVFGSSEDAMFKVDTVISHYQPVWANQFFITSQRLPTRREQIALDMTPLKMMVKLVKSYNGASINGKCEIRKKLFNDKLIEACLNSLDNINKLK